MTGDREEGGRLYKARGPDGEVAWVDHEELWRLQQSQVEGVRREHARRRRLMLLALAGLVVVALVLVFFRLWSGAESGVVAEPPAPIEADAETVTAGPEPPAIAETADPSAPTAATERIAAVVAAWAGAWSRQDVPAYLGSYAAEFRPVGGLSRSSWESLRRQRLLEPASIRVEIERLRITPLEEGRVEARFVQRYSSPRYSDVVIKRLVLVEETGEWRIAAERAEAPTGPDLG